MKMKELIAVALLMTLVLSACSPSSSNAGPSLSTIAADFQKTHDGFHMEVNQTDGEHTDLLSFHMSFDEDLPYEDILAFYQSEFDDLFHSLVTLHSEGFDAGELLDDMYAYFGRTEPLPTSPVIWVKRIGNYHLEAIFSSLKNMGADYYISDFSIMDHNTYESDLVSHALDNYHFFVEDSVLNLLSPVEGHTFNIVEGRLEDIRVSEEPPSIFYTITDRVSPGSYEGLLQARLVDDTGSLEVYVFPTSLNNDELSETRKHYVSGVMEEDIYVPIVISSTLPT